MRVEIVTELSPAGAPAAPADSKAAQAFLTAVNSDDSLFDVSLQGTWAPGAEKGREKLQGFAGSWTVRFRDESQHRNRGLYFTFLEKLAALLRETEAADSLQVRIALAEEYGGGKQMRMGLELRATGGSREQAELRWGLGLAHVQQAILFISRYFRQQLSARND